MNHLDLRNLRRRAACGFSLVEVLVALALGTWAFLSIGGLLVVASRTVRAGRSHSVALSIARGVLEELNGGGFDSAWERLDLDGSTASARVDSRTNPWAARWQGALDASLRDARAEIELRSLSPVASAPLRDAAEMVVAVTVHWSDGARPRRLRIATVRT